MNQKVPSDSIHVGVDGENEKRKRRSERSGEM